MNDRVIGEERHNFRLVSAAGWNFEVWTNASRYTPPSTVNVVVEVTPPNDFSGTHKLEISLASSTIGGARKSFDVSFTKELPRQLVPRKYRVQVSDAFLSSPDSIGAASLNLGKHKILIRIRTDPGPSVTVEDISLEIVVHPEMAR